MIFSFGLTGVSPRSRPSCSGRRSTEPGEPRVRTLDPGRRGCHRHDVHLEPLAINPRSGTKENPARQQRLVLSHAFWTAPRGPRAGCVRRRRPACSGGRSGCRRGASWRSKAPRPHSKMKASASGGGWGGGALGLGVAMLSLYRAGRSEASSVVIFRYRIRYLLSLI